MAEDGRKKFAELPQEEQERIMEFLDRTGYNEDSFDEIEESGSAYLSEDEHELFRIGRDMLIEASIRMEEIGYGKEGLREPAPGMVPYSADGNEFRQAETPKEAVFLRMVPESAMSNVPGTGGRETSVTVSGDAESATGRITFKVPASQAFPAKDLSGKDIPGYMNVRLDGSKDIEVSFLDKDGTQAHGIRSAKDIAAGWSKDQHAKALEAASKQAGPDRAAEAMQRLGDVAAPDAPGDDSRQFGS